MSVLQFPCKIFETQKKMNDKNAKDMNSGDLSEIDLKAKFHLTDISTIDWDRKCYPAEQKKL